MWYQLPIHMALVVTWMAMWGSFTPFHLFAGTVVGGAILYGLAKGTGQPFYLSRFWALIKFLAVFLWHVFLSSIFVARIAFTPNPKNRPGIVALPLRLKSDGAITALAHMLTLTPGAVPIDITPDKKEIFIHCLDLNDLDSVRQSKELFEDLIMGVTE